MAELKILSLNVWGLAFISKDRPPRLAAIGEYLSKSDYDVVCLQELWIHKDFENMRDDVQSVLPHSRFFHTGALGSGLAIFTRFPIIEAHALPYALSGCPSEVIDGDFFVNKAAARAVLTHPQVGEIEIWNTHMHAAGEASPEERQAHRMTQAWQLATEIRGGAQRGRYVFAMGDFNSQPFSVPIAIMRTHGGLRDSFLDTHPQANDAPPAGLLAADALTTLGMTCDSNINTWSGGKNIPENILAQGGKRLDYIFYRDPALPPGVGAEGKRVPSVRCTSSEVVLTELVPGAPFSYSDHFGLTSSFAFDSPSRKGSGSNTPSDPRRSRAQAPLLPLDDDPPSPVQVASDGASAYELSRAPSSGSTISAIRTATHTIKSYMRLANARTLRHEQYMVACVVGTIVLAVGSAWQPKSWIQPIFTLLAFAMGGGAATFLYTGWLWGRWERGQLDEFMAEMELELRVLGSRE